MLQESIEDLLRQVSVERQPLSRREKEEAMEVAKKIRAKVIQIAGDEEHSDFSSDTPTRQRISLYKGESVSDHKPADPETNLVIVVSDIENEVGKIKRYYFAPIAVTETVLNLKDVLPINTKDDLSTGDIVRSDIADIQFLQGMKLRLERTPQEIFHPDKADLEGVLSALSSAKPWRQTLSNSL